jgi:predicted nucleic acid-binding protein
VSVARQVVLDASVGVKWFCAEAGSEDALELLRAHGADEIEIVVSSLFVWEIVAVAARSLSAEDAREFWERFVTWRVVVAEVGDSLVRDALAVRERLDCSLYDAVAPALASQLGAPLCSADRKAHAEWPGVQLLG